MKTLQIRLSDEEHTAIKVEAARLGLSIKNFVMARVEQFQPEPASRGNTSPTEPRSAEGNAAHKTEVFLRSKGLENSSIAPSIRKNYGALQKPGKGKAK